jgi:hypothetical protein
MLQMMDVEPKLDVRYEMQKTLYDRRHVVHVAAVLHMSEFHFEQSGSSAPTTKN